MKRIVRVLALVLIVSLIPVSAFAASGRPYKDVTVKTVGKTNYKAVKKCKKWGATRVFVKKNAKKLHPYKKVTRRQVVKALAKASKTGIAKMPAYDKANKKATVGFFAKYAMKLDKEVYGMTIEYDDSVLNSTEPLDRALLCGYIYLHEKVARIRNAAPIGDGGSDESQ